MPKASQDRGFQGRVSQETQAFPRQGDEAPLKPLDEHLAALPNPALNPEAGGRGRVRRAGAGGGRLDRRAWPRRRRVGGRAWTLWRQDLRALSRPHVKSDRESLSTFVRLTVSGAGIPLPELSVRLRAAASANGGRLHVLSYRDLSGTPDSNVKPLTLIPRDRMLEHKYLLR